jgi:hypothetical protein
MSTATLSTATKNLRTELGDFSSIICFRALVTGLQEALGEKAALIAVIAAGRARGRGLAQSLDLAGTEPDLARATP